MVAETADDMVETGTTIGRRRIGFKHAARGAFNLVANAPKNLGSPVNDRLEQAIEHRARLVPAPTWLDGAIGKIDKGARLVIAHCDQRFLRQDKGNGDQIGGRRIRIADDARRHVMRAIVGIKQA